MRFAISINFVKFRFHGRVFGGAEQEALIVAFDPNNGKKIRLEGQYYSLGHPNNYFH